LTLCVAMKHSNLEIYNNEKRKKMKARKRGHEIPEKNASFVTYQ
jgi:hypothetical protein